MSRLTSVAMVSAAMVMISACASTTPTQTQAVSAPAALQKEELAGRTALVWRAKDFDPRRYTKFIVDPVTVYRGADASFDGASEEELRGTAQFVQREFIRVLNERRALGAASGPDTARLKLTLAGLESNTPGVATVTSVLPVGLAVNLANSAMGQPGNFTGSATIAGQVTDSATNAPLVSFIQKRYPDALDITATLSTRDAHQTAITQAAEAFGKRLDEIHGRR